MTSFLTDDEVEKIQTLPRKTPYVMRGVSMGFFSVARYYGGCKFNDEHYTYNPETDELIRDDVLAFVMKLRRKKKPAKGQAEEEATVTPEPRIIDGCPVQPLALKLSLEFAEAEIVRLAAALHAAKAHPDYSYLTVPAGGMNQIYEAVTGGYERCQEAETPGAPDEVWRRRKDAN